MSLKIVDPIGVRLALFVCVVAAILASIGAEESKTEYKFLLDKFTKEKEDSDILKSSLKFDKHGDDVVITGDVVQLVDLDNKWKTNIAIFRSEEAGGEFVQMMATPELGICDILRSYYKMFFYASLQKHMNAPDPEKCPVARERYSIKDYPLDSGKFTKYLMPGFYRVVGTLSLKDDEKLKYIIDGHVEKKM